MGRNRGLLHNGGGGSFSSHALLLFDENVIFIRIRVRLRGKDMCESGEEWEGRQDLGSSANDSSSFYMRLIEAYEKLRAGYLRIDSSRAATAIKSAIIQAFSKSQNHFNGSNLSTNSHIYIFITSPLNLYLFQIEICPYKLPLISSATKQRCVLSCHGHQRKSLYST